jgi:type IV secretory pathway TrbD component
MLRRLPFHRVLHRPATFLGGEREPALLVAVICGGLAATGMNVVAFTVAGGIWLAAMPLLRWVAKADPQMSRVYVRSLRYRGFYPPRSRPYRDAEPPRRGFYLGLAAVLLGLAWWAL